MAPTSFFAFLLRVVIALLRRHANISNIRNCIGDRGGELVTQSDYSLPGRQEDFTVESEDVKQLRQPALPTTPAGSTVAGPRQQAFQASSTPTGD